MVVVVGEGGPAIVVVVGKGGPGIVVVAVVSGGVGGVDTGAVEGTVVASELE